MNKLICDIRKNSGKKIETVYFGGGTPSVLKAEDVKRIMTAIKENFDTTSLTEITFEANPDDLTQDYIEMLLENGINRLSIGIQSFNDEHLKIMNRRHDSEKGVECVKNVKNAGFSNITIDLIYGLPFMTERQWQENLDIAVNIGVQHISAYHLTIEEGTMFWRKGLKAVSEEVSEKHYSMLRETMETGGFIQYEISNFAKKGYEAIHNSGYWKGVPYLGIGPSAHSFDGKNCRWWQPANISLWLNGKSPEKELLTESELREERIMTSLRTVHGLDSPEKYTNMEKAERFIRDGIMKKENGRLYILPKYFLISDYIISELF